MDKEDRPLDMTPHGIRRLVCARCGTSFTCSPGGGCWCAAEPYRMPLTDLSEDCLCPDCLRKAARATGKSVI